jgi:hypothetical protein
MNLTALKSVKQHLRADFFLLSRFVTDGQALVVIACCFRGYLANLRFMEVMFFAEVCAKAEGPVGE